MNFKLILIVTFSLLPLISFAEKHASENLFSFKYEQNTQSLTFYKEHNNKMLGSYSPEDTSLLITAEDIFNPRIISVKSNIQVLVTLWNLGKIGEAIRVFNPSISSEPICEFELRLNENSQLKTKVKKLKLHISLLESKKIVWFKSCSLGKN